MPKVVDHEQMRKDLVKTSASLFAKKGFAVSMRTVASTLKVTTGTLYHYFPNKDALLHAVVEEATTSDQSATSVLFTCSVEERLPLLLRYFDDHQEEFLQRWLLIAEALRQDDAALHQRLRLASTAYAAGLAALLELPTRGGEVVLALVNGLLMRSQLGMKVVFVDEEPLFRRLLIDSVSQSQTSAR